MRPDQIAVAIGGLAAIAFIVWFFWLGKRTGVQAAATSSGYQEALIVVKGAYSPDTIRVQAGRPVRLTFLRQETSSCSEMVLFPDFGKSAALPEGRRVSIELLPPAPGRYGFQCQMGMLRGTLVAE